LRDPSCLAAGGFFYCRLAHGWPVPIFSGTLIEKIYTDFCHQMFCGAKEDPFLSVASVCYKIFIPLVKLKTMTLLGFLVLLAIAAICGAIGQSLAGYDLGGCLVSIIVGFIGAYLGMWLAGKMDLPEFFTINIQGKSFPIIWAIIGSAIFTLIMALLRKTFVGGNRK
jgi:uncharacterized membrane protein YeaQ/YmgE (transglycosylase-associated protein family)